MTRRFVLCLFDDAFPELLLRLLLCILFHVAAAFLRLAHLRSLDLFWLLCLKRSVSDVRKLLFIELIHDVLVLFASMLELDILEAFHRRRIKISYQVEIDV